MYAEGMKLAKKYEEEEKELAEKLKVCPAPPSDYDKVVLLLLLPICWLTNITCSLTNITNCGDRSLLLFVLQGCCTCGAKQLLMTVASFVGVYRSQCHVVGFHMALILTSWGMESLLVVVTQSLTGSTDDLLAAQRSPKTPLQRLADHAQEVAGQVSALKAQRAEAAGNAYLEYVLDKHLAFLNNPENMRFEELELPEVIRVSWGVAATAAWGCWTAEAGTGTAC